MKQSNKTWFEIGEVFGTDGENVRAWAKKQEWFHKIREKEKITDALKDKVKEQTHNRQNGIITSNINKKLKEQQTFTDDELLEGMVNTIFSCSINNNPCSSKIIILVPPSSIKFK